MSYSRPQEICLHFYLKNLMLLKVILYKYKYLFNNMELDIDKENSKSAELNTDLESENNSKHQDLDYARTVTNQIHTIIGVNNVIPNDFNKTFISGLV